MSRPLPHNGVFVRLGVSDIHGIGVFAGQPVAAGANVLSLRRAPSPILYRRPASI
jgi:hypothetical protein